MPKSSWCWNYKNMPRCGLKNRIWRKLARGNMLWDKMWATLMNDPPSWKMGTSGNQNPMHFLKQMFMDKWGPCSSKCSTLNLCHCHVGKDLRVNLTAQKFYPIKKTFIHFWISSIDWRIWNFGGTLAFIGILDIIVPRNFIQQACTSNLFYVDITH